MCLFSWLGGHALAKEQSLSFYLQQLREATPVSLSDKVSFTDAAAVTEQAGLSYLLSAVLRSAGSSLPLALGSFLSFCGLALLGALATLLWQGKDKHPSKDILERAMCVLLALSVFRVAEPCLQNAMRTLSDMQTFFGAMLPVTGALYLAGGNVGTASVAGASGTLTLSLCEMLSESLLSPLVAASLSLALLGALSGGRDGYGIAEQIRRLFSTLLGAFVTVASASLALQCSVAGAADSAALRTARYAVAQAVPLVGSAVSASLGTVSASVSLIKQTLGAGAVVVLVLLVLPVLVELLLLKCALSMGALVSQMLGFSAGKSVFSSMEGIFAMVMAALAWAGVLFAVSVAVFMKTAVAVGVS